MEFDYEQFRADVEALDHELGNLPRLPTLPEDTPFAMSEYQVPFERDLEMGQVQPTLPPIKIESSYKPTDPSMLRYVMDNIEEFSEYDIFNLNSVIYNEKSKNVATQYQAATVQKVLKIISFKYGLSMKELYPLCGSEHLNKCCSLISKGFCRKPAVYGHFFCERHLPGTDLVMGLNAYERRLQNGNIPV